jgi:hypothetical protein
MCGLCLLLLGCSDETVTPHPITSACAYQVAGTCVGASTQALCAQAACVAGVACEKVLPVANDAELAAAVGSAQPGDCIALAPGQYSAVTVPASVSLLGKGVAEVSVAGVVLAGGNGAVVRGMTIGGGGLRLEATMGALIDTVSVVDSAIDGIEAAQGASFSAVGVDVRGAARYGISAFDSGTITLERVAVSGSQGPGLWAQCASGCDCASKPMITVTTSLITDNKTVGVSLAGVIGVLQTVDITEHAELGFDPSGGMAVHGCAQLSMVGSRLLDNSSYGLLVDHASATIGGPTPAEAVEISRNQYGAWVQQLEADGSQPVGFDHCVLEANQAVGLGLSGESKGIMFWNSGVLGTLAKIVPAYDQGVAKQAEIGDAISWSDFSGADVKNVTLSGNARAAILIDGDVAQGSSIASLVLSGGDEQKGVVQQNLPVGGMAPMVDATVSVQQSTTTVPIARAPLPPQF